MRTSAYLNAKQGFTDYSVYLQDSNSETTVDPQLDFGSGAAAFMYRATPQAQSLYVTEAGDSTPISVNDINQGQLSDCFVLSSFGEQALFHPDAITNMIHDNGNGTETVTLYVDRSGRLPTYYSTSFRPIAVTVDNNFAASSVNSAAAQDVLGNLKEIWPQVIEKAVATLGGGYGSIANGGSPLFALEELTGHSASLVSPPRLTFDALSKSIAAGDLIVMDTSSKRGLPFGLVSSHAYMFEKLTGSDGSAMVQLHNPWGYDQPAAIPLARLAQSGVIEVDIGHTA